MMLEKMLGAALIALVVLGANPAAASEKKPVIAVFEIATRKTQIPQTSLQALTTFLSARVAATGLYRVTPQETVRQRLKAQKKASYKLCYDRSCQIEIGRELAADHALATELAKVGENCLLSVKLYELKRETTEFAHAEPLPCDEGALGSALVRAVVALRAWREKTASAPSSATTTTAATGLKGLVRVRSKPSADLLIDDLQQGRTPKTLNLEADKVYRLSLMREGYKTYSTTISPRTNPRVDVALELTESGRIELASAGEWFVLGLGFGYVKGESDALFSVSIGFLGRIKWHRVFWMPAELTLAFVPQSQQSTSSADGGALLMIGTRLGFPLYLGARGQHQLLFGLGAGYLGFDDGVGESKMSKYFGLSPSLTYLYNAASGIVPVGFSVRGLLPVVGSPEEGQARPFGVTFNAEIGFSFWRMMKGAITRGANQ